MNGLRSMLLITALVTNQVALEAASATPTVSSAASPAAAVPNVAEAPTPAPGPGAAGGIPAFPDRRPLTLSNVAAALRARGLTNQAMALTNRALATTKATLLPGTRTGAVDLRGIVNAPKLKCAVLEVPPRPGALPVERILEERERLDDLEVVKIDPRSGEVTIRQAEEDRVLKLPRQPNEADASVAPSTLDLRAAKLESVLDLYQEFAGRTVLHSPLLASSRLTVKTGPVPVPQVIKVLDKALAESSVIMAPHGKKFVIALPARDAAKLDALPAAPETTVGSSEEIPPGVIKFAEADLWPVLEIYQDLTGRTILRSSPLPYLKITVKTQTELSRADVIHLHDVLLALGGVCTRPDGDKFVFVVPSSQQQRLPAIMAQRKTPPVSDGPAAKPADLQPAGQLRFQETDLVQVMNVYGVLTGRTAVWRDSTPAVKLTLKSQTDLTRREAIYALDALAAVNHLKFLPVGDREVTVVPLAQADRGLSPQTPEKF